MSLQPTVWPFASSGKSGPIVQVPGWLASAGGVYSAVWPLAPAKNARPSLSSTPAPISLEVTSMMPVGRVPPSTQVLAAARYLSALRELSQRTVITVSSGSSTQLSRRSWSVWPARAESVGGWVEDRGPGVVEVAQEHPSVG